MNATDKKELTKASQLVNEAREIVEGIQSQEQEKFDNLGERAQEGERGQAIQEGATALEEIAGLLQDAGDQIDSLT